MTNPSLSNRDYRSLAAFRHALRKFEAFSEAAARDAGLTPSQHQLLLAVRGHPEPQPSTSDLAEMLQLKLHSVTELAARTHARGLLERSSDPDDARRVVWALSGEGEEKLAGLSVTHREELRRFRREMNDVLQELEP